MATKRTYKYSLKHRKAISKSLKGRTLTKAHSKKISLANKGKTAWNKGLKGKEYLEHFPNGMKSIWQKGYKQSKEHTRKIIKSLTGKSGEKNHNWKGGRRIQRGYIRIYMPNHPFCNINKCILEHRLVMEKYLGRYLRLEEVVHHENEIRDDNRIENLKLFKNQKEHIRYHESLRNQKPLWKRIVNFMFNTFKEKWKHIVEIITR